MLNLQKPPRRTAKNPSEINFGRKEKENRRNCWKNYKLCENYRSITPFLAHESSLTCWKLLNTQFRSNEATPDVSCPSSPFNTTGCNDYEILRNVLFLFCLRTLPLPPFTAETQAGNTSSSSFVFLYSESSGK